MVYSQANQILGCALTPNNRGICKKTARDNNADMTPLAGFADNRLLPVTTGYVKLKQYTINFLDYDGSILQTRSIPHGTVPTYTGSITPSRTGYHWNNGWTPTVVAATADANYTATFDINTYTISYSTDVNGWTDTRSVTHGSQEPDIHPTISGYTFQYWTPALGTATGDASHVAHYTQNTVYYIITFEDYDGTPLWSGQVEAGTTPTYPYSDPTRSGWTFSGWSPSIGAATQDQTYTATYTEDVPRVVMLASVDWRVAEDASGTPYNDPSNIYMTDPDYLPSDTIAVNVWFEPWYKDINTGVELTNHWTDPIATVDGVSVCHNDLSWSVTQPTTSTNGYWWWHRLGGGYNNWDGTIILRPIEVPTQDAVDNKPGRNWRASVQSESNKQGDPMYRDLWEDKIPLRFVGSYGGQTVVDKTIYIWVHYG